MNHFRKIILKKLYSLRITFFVMAFLLIPISFLYASNIYPLAPVVTFAVGDVIPVTIYVNAENESINTIGATVVFPNEYMSLVDVTDKDSIITHWIEKPHAVDESSVVFAGIIPGGFSGMYDPVRRPDNTTSEAKIITLYFKALKTGQSDIFLKDFQLLLNDGEGTASEAHTMPFYFSIDMTSHYMGSFGALDILPPLSFVVTISRDPNAYDNKFFAVFNTQDLESGIDYYEVKEGDGKWIRTDSPYVLMNQDEHEPLFVKAIDKAGNNRIQSINEITQTKSNSPTQMLIAIILLAILLVIAKIYSPYGRRKKKTK